LGEFVSFDEAHKDDPALPDRLPTGLAVGRAGEKATQPGDAAQEVPVGSEALCRLLELGGEDLGEKTASIGPSSAPRRRKDHSPTPPFQQVLL